MAIPLRGHKPRRTRHTDRAARRGRYLGPQAGTHAHVFALHHVNDPAVRPGQVAPAGLPPVSPSEKAAIFRIGMGRAGGAFCTCAGRRNGKGLLLRGYDSIQPTGKYFQAPVFVACAGGSAQKESM